ncbi:MAG: DMT family transporter [bacterium]
MDLHFVMVISLAVVAALCLNIGKAVQKMHVQVLKKGRGMLREHRREFLGWLTGILMTFIAGGFFVVAQNMTDKTSIVTSMNGVGLIGLALFSYFVLKERVGVREWGAVMLIIAGTVTVLLFKEFTGHERNISLPGLYWSCGVTAAIFTVLTLLAIRVGRGRALILAAVAGTFLGLMHIFFHAGPQVEFGGGQLWEQVRPAALYIFIGFMLGNGGFFYTNWAFFHGSGIYVVPTVNSFLMITPMIYEVFIFNATLTPMQYVGAAVIIAGVVVLTTGTGHTVAGHIVEGGGRRDGEAMEAV